MFNHLPIDSLWDICFQLPFFKLLQRFSGRFWLKKTQVQKIIHVIYELFVAGHVEYWTCAWPSNKSVYEPRFSWQFSWNAICFTTNALCAGFEQNEKHLAGAFASLASHWLAKLNWLPWMQCLGKKHWSQNHPQSNSFLRERALWKTIWTNPRCVVHGVSLYLSLSLSIYLYIYTHI